MSMETVTFLFFVLFITAILLSQSLKIVPQGYHYTVERLGKYIGTLSPGLGIILPFIDRVGVRMNMMERVLEVPNQEIITRDNAMVQVDGVLFFKVLDAERAAYGITHLENALLNLTMNNIRTVLGSMELDELLSLRDEINQRVLKIVDHAVVPWGVEVTRIEIKDINPPRDLVESMARQMKAERDKRAAILVAEGEQQAAILRAEGEKRSMALVAEGRKEAGFRDAEARERAAEAEARATEVVSKAISGGTAQAVNYFVATHYIKALEVLAHSPNQKVLILPLETTSLIGSLAGISEIVKDTFSPGNLTPQGGGPGGSQGKPHGEPRGEPQSTSLLKSFLEQTSAPKD